MDVRFLAIQETLYPAASANYEVLFQPATD